MFRKFFCIVVLGVWTAALFPFTIITMVLTFSPRSTIWIARKLWSPVMVWAGGAQLTVDGLEHVDPTRPTVYVANHQSTLDIPVMFMALPVNLRFVAKKQLAYVP